MSARTVGAALAVLLALAGAAADAAPAARLAPFLDRLRAAGRAEVRLSRRAFDPASGAERMTHGRVALEPPALARLDFAGGESITLRDDGGEWLEPALAQLVRLGPERARGALGWCDLLLDARASDISQQDLADGRVLLVRQAPDFSDSAWVTLDAHALPSALEYHDGPGASERLTLQHWTFSHARGRAAFVLQAPHGYEVVDLP